MPPARVFAGPRGRPRQDPCRGSSSSGSYLDSQAFGLHKDLHATTQAPLSLGLDAVDGVSTLSLKGGSLAGISQVAPARLLPGLCRPSRQGCCRGKSILPLCSSCLWLECCFWQPHSFPSSTPPSMVAGVATTALAQVKGYRKAPTFVHRQEPKLMKMPSY